MPYVMARRDQQQRHQEEGDGKIKLPCCPCRFDPVWLVFGGLVFFLVFVILFVSFMEVPKPPSPSLLVHGASASRFELDGGGDGATLRYNLDLNVSVCNEDKESTYLLYHVVATALYGGQPLGYSNLVDPGEPLLLPNTDGCIPTAPPLRPALFRGEMALPAGSEAAVLYWREEGEGLFTIDVHLDVLKMEASGDGDGNPEDSGREFYKTMNYMKQETSVKLRRPE